VIGEVDRDGSEQFSLVFANGFDPYVKQYTNRLPIIIRHELCISDFDRIARCPVRGIDFNVVSGKRNCPLWRSFCGVIDESLEQITARCERDRVIVCLLRISDYVYHGIVE
jgi:hypothetical protein